MRDPNTQNLLVQSMIDRSNFLRALLLFIKSDRNIWDHEKQVFIQEGVRLGFNKSYCEQALRDSLNNKYISGQVPVFHFKEYAVRLFTIGLDILTKDTSRSAVKIEFLKELLIQNKILAHRKTKVLQLSAGL